ncbi:molecular chaperone DnaJ [bacterium]|nr:molecular chaperone DnaJ [bacterium]
MAGKRDYYEVLGVSREVSGDVLKKAYRNLAKKYHPDANREDKNTEEKFKQVNEAYEVLQDPRKRAAYDQFGHAGIHAGAGVGRGGGGGRGTGDFGDMGDVFSDIFEGFFGGQQSTRTQAKSRRGADLRYDLSISFLDSARGKEVHLNVPRMETCEVCRGTGAKSGTRAKTCSACHGAGQVRMSQGFFSVMRTCPTCGGAGEIVESPCSACGGEGRKRTLRKITVKIPPGVDTESRLKISGEGEAGLHGGPRGDLYVIIRVEPHPIFTREDDFLLCEIIISFTTAALGGEIEVPTLNGKVTMKIPMGTQTGKVFRLRGKGFPNLRGLGTGDQMVTVGIETPESLSEKQKQLLQEFARVTGEESYPGIKKFRNKIRAWFK